ncbi:DUF6270 domain-containing protein [Bacillus cereus]|uniref:Uncharacterized protein n=1 Tax=Bacillus cereus TaxID=1396 RepID=A0A1S9UIV7_BACCE|nr:DUF6270 domain-containing protein [Bacillus cereus]OOR22145.1 hypothetical protein BW892_20310 [Bacillus cereus]
MTKKIAILGSCVSRDNFNSLFNPNYKLFFEVNAYHHQSSILSLMSEPLPFEEDEQILKLGDFGKWHLKTELNKEFLNHLANKKQDYLIIDFFGDIYYETLVLDESNYLTENPKFANVPFLKKYTNKISIQNNKELYLRLWKEKIDSFFSLLKEKTPQTKIILNKTRLLDTFKNGKSLTEYRKTLNAKIVNVNELNNLWDILDKYVVDKYDVTLFDMTQKEYHLSETHPWKSFYVHYTMDFYDDFFHKLLKFDVNQLQIEMEHTKKKVENMVHEIETSKRTISLATNQINDLNQNNLDLISKVNVMENENFIGFIKRKRAFKKEDK